MKKLLLTFTIIFSIFSCAPSYYKEITKTPAPANKQSAPDYANLDMWAAHPYKKDPSDSTPKPYRKEWKDSTVDVFFLYPTTFTDPARVNELNASVYNDTLNAKTDYSSILYQSTIFNQQSRIFAPRYRQAHYGMFSYADTEKANAAFDTAYSDIRQAFLYYLEHFKGRPIIIAGHSQGAFHAKRLLREFFDTTTLRNRLVAAYLIGMPIRQDDFTNIPPCRDSLQTGCFVSWRTFRKGYEGPEYISREQGDIVVVNPLTWTTDSVLAPRTLHKGAVLYKFNKRFKATNDAQVHNHILWISRPKFPGAAFYQSKNYHIGDLNLFYGNVREDVTRRIGLYWKR
jgi:pimeloyl-ACP methyl ester carboxylesterase